MKHVRFLFGKCFRLQKEARLIAKGENPEFQNAIKSAEGDKKSMDNAQEIRTVILNALRDDGKFDAKKEAEQLWNSLQKFIMELPLLQKQSMGEVNALLANVRKEFPKDTNELAEFAVYMNFLTPGELVAVSREGGSSAKDARACQDGKCKTPDSSESLTPVPEEAPKKKETRKSLEAKVRASRADIDDYNSKRVSILKDYESQKYKNPADRRKAYKEACAKIQALRGSMGNPVGTYWENRNQWEARTKQSWSRKLAAESGRDVLDLPEKMKREQARVIRIVDEKTGNLLAAYDEWTANYTGSIRQADALALIRSKQDDIATMRKGSGGRYLDLRIDASGVKRFGDEERAVKEKQNERDQQNMKILANRDSIGSKLDGLQGYKGRMAKKYLADAEADIAQAMRKKSASRIDARAMARADHAVERENRISSIQESQPEISVEPYRGSAGEILEVRRKNGNTLMEISLGSENNLKEGQTLDCWRVDGSTAKYLCRATVLQVEGKRALVRMDRGMVKVAPSVGDTIGPRTEDWERKGAPKPNTFKEPKKAPFTERLKPATPAPTTETTSPRSSEKSQAAPVDAPKLTPSPSNGMTFEEGNEFMRPIDSSPVPAAPKKAERTPKKPASIPNLASPKSSSITAEPINIPSEPPDPVVRKDPAPKVKTGSRPFDEVNDTDDIVADIGKQALQKKEVAKVNPPEAPSSLALLRTDIVARKLPVDPRRLEKLADPVSLEDVRDVIAELRKQKIDPRLLDRVEADVIGKIERNRKEAEVLVQKNLDGDLASGLEAAALRRAGVKMPDQVEIDSMQPSEGIRTRALQASKVLEKQLANGRTFDDVIAGTINFIKKLTSFNQQQRLAIATKAMRTLAKERPELFVRPAPGFGNIYYAPEMHFERGTYVVPTEDLDVSSTMTIKPDMSIFNENAVMKNSESTSKQKPGTDDEPPLKPLRPTKK